jgi:hypothetical protein
MVTAVKGTAIPVRAKAIGSASAPREAFLIVAYSFRQGRELAGFQHRGRSRTKVDRLRVARSSFCALHP